MHRPALARPQGRAIRGRGAQTRALENRLAWHRTSRSRTHRGSRGPTGRSDRARRRSRPQWRLVHRTRSGLRNDHPWRRRCHRRRCARGYRPGRHAWWLRRRNCGPLGRHDGRCGASRRPRGRNRRRYGSWRHRSHRSCGLRRRGRRWSREGWPRGRSWNYKFRRSGRRRSGRLRRGNGCGRCWRSSRLGLDGRRSLRRGIHSRGPLLFTDDGF
jgi:hypothetical protein